MTLGDILLPQRALVFPEALDLKKAVSGLARALALPGGDKARLEFETSVMARENAGSTGIGRGVAIPHARTRSLESLRLATSVCRSPVDFKSADAKPVSLIFLLAIPETAPSSHLKTLAALSRTISDAKLLKHLNKAQSPQELHILLADIPVD